MSKHRSIHSTIAIVASLAASVAGMPANAADGMSGVKTGVMTCNVSGGWGFVFGSSRDLNCTYDQGVGPTERYTGHIDKFGMDIGYQAGGVIAWAVIAPSHDMGEGSLSGNYGGVSASATVGVGLGANALIGNSSKSITLQPLSLEGNTGLNAAAGVATIKLDYAVE